VAALGIGQGLVHTGSAAPPRPAPEIEMSDNHYDCEVDRGDLSMHWLLLKDTLNARCRDGGGCTSSSSSAATRC